MRGGHQKLKRREYFACEASSDRCTNWGVPIVGYMVGLFTAPSDSRQWQVTAACSISGSGLG